MVKFNAAVYFISKKPENNEVKTIYIEFCIYCSTHFPSHCVMILQILLYVFPLLLDFFGHPLYICKKPEVDFETMTPTTLPLIIIMERTRKNSEKEIVQGTALYLSTIFHPSSFCTSYPTQGQGDPGGERQHPWISQTTEPTNTCLWTREESCNIPRKPLKHEPLSHRAKCVISINTYMNDDQHISQIWEKNQKHVCT